MNSGGDFVVVWHDNGDYTTSTVQARRWNASGTPATGVFPISGGSPGIFDAGASIASDSAGNFLVVWTRSIQALGEGDATPMGRFSGADGSLGGNEFQINQITTGFQSNPIASLNDDGAFVVAFLSSPSYQVYENKGPEKRVALESGHRGRPERGRLVAERRKQRQRSPRA